MSVISLTLSNYIMIAEMLGLWVLLDSNIHLKRRTINVTRVVIVLIFIEAICWAVERYEISYLTTARIILAPTIYLLHPVILLGINETIYDYSGKKNYDVEYRLKVKSGECSLTLTPKRKAENSFGE